MATYKDFLIQSAPVAAWMLDSATSTEVDITMSGHDATAYVIDDYANPLVSGAQRTYTIKSGDFIYYPPLNVWGGGGRGTPFSIEFVLHTLTTTDDVVIFSPRDTNGVVFNNQISVKNNKLSFIISDSTSGTIGENTYEAYTFLDFTGDTVHCVAVYQPGSISLYINGILESNISVPPNFDWQFSPDQSIAYQTAGGINSEIMLQALAVYKRPLNKEQVIRHYRALMLRPSPVEVVKSSGGKPFLINDSDRIKNFYFSEPAMSGWGSPIMDNVSIDDNNRISLDVIEPPELNSGAVTFTTSHLDLSSSQYLKIADAGKHLGTGTGAFGVNMRYTAARHGAATSQYSLLSLMSSDKRCMIEVIEKSDKQMYLKYTSDGTSVEQNLVAPSTIADSDNYVYVEYTPSQIRAFWNSSTTSAIITIGVSDGITSPNFDDGSTLIVGASPDGDLNWGSHVWWLNIWDVPRNLSAFTDLINSTYQYTLKLAADLNVSQAGAVIWEIDTGFDGTQVGEDLVNQSRIWWAPSISNQNLRVETSLSGGWDADFTDTPDVGGDYGYLVQYDTQYGPSEIDPSSAYSDQFEDAYEPPPSGGYEVQTNMGPIEQAPYGAFIPETLYLKAILHTDDSVNNVVYLKKIGLDIFRDATVIGEASADQLVFNTEPNIYFSLDNIGLQTLYHGARITNPASGLKIYSAQTTDPISDAPGIPEVATVSPAAELSNARTLEFWIRPYGETTGLVFKYSGTDTHSCSWNGTTRTMTATGFDKMYIDGIDTPMGVPTSASWSAGWETKWHLVHLVLNDVVKQTDSTIFTAISGTPTVTLDSTKWYRDSKSVKIVAGASQGFVQIYNSLTGINTAASAYHTLSFYIYPNTGVTSVVTNFRRNGVDSLQTHSGLTPDAWNLVTRTFQSGGTTTTTFDVRIGTASGSQTIWIDWVGLVKGQDAFIRFTNGPTNNVAAFGYDPASPLTEQADFHLQNVAVYPDSLTQAQVTANKNAYLGAPAVQLNSSNSNLCPATGYLTSFPATVLNRNLVPGDIGYGDELFDHNPIHLQSAWQIISSN